MLALIVVIANLPDLDFLPGFLTGNPNQFHHHFLSHSLGGAILASALLAGCFSFFQKRSFLPLFAIFASVYFSHVLLDYFSTDTSQPYGVPMFWPFSQDYFISPVPLFLSIEKSGSGLAFISGLFVKHNLYAIAIEFLVLVPALIVTEILRRSKPGLLGRTAPKPKVEQVAG